ncbi:MAG TPA: hypothetical protein VL749_05855 [Patescibacteria group bacterium]|nr:hypothetical protein [Patescibacteria group bacterium]
MRPDDLIDPAVAAADAVVPLPVDLRPLDAELEQSGARARLMLHGRTQPTRYFVIDLRARLLSDYAADRSAGGVGTDVIAGPSPVSRGQVEVRRQSIAPAPPTVVAQAAAPAGPAVVFDVRVALFVAAVASAALILGAIGSGVIPH